MHETDTTQSDSVNGLVVVDLFAYQAKDLWALVRRQHTDRKGAIFMSVAPHMVDEGGWSRLRLQAAFVPHLKANKIIKIIQSELTTKETRE
jgi:hypothetical protein